MLAGTPKPRNARESLGEFGRYVQMRWHRKDHTQSIQDTDRQPVTDSASSKELQALLDAAVDGIVVIDHLGMILSFNRSAERLFGFQAAEALGRNVTLLMTEPDRRGHDAAITKYLTTRIPRIIGRGREVVAQRSDGSVFPAFLSVGAVPGADPPRFVGFIRDITASREAETDAHRLQDRLMHVSRLATVGEMASGIAHEVNQPLAAIATYAHACDRLLGMPDPQIDEIQDALKQIAEQAVRAGDIIRRLRDLARAGESARSAVDINTVIAELADLIRSDAKAHGVQYRQELAPDLPKVSVDRAQIQQVVLNLVRNALEALAVGQFDTPEVVVRTRRTPEEDIEISVCDNGPGVDPALAQRIFDPFCSTKATGTGLGLPISRTIVRTHGGALDFRPNVPAGACFVVKLPETRTDPP
jgi:two-component system sensor kinase FixL